MSRQDDIIRGYSPEITKRLFTYLRPYKTATAITIITLAASTLAELAAPIVLQRTLDDHVLRREYRLEAGAADELMPEKEDADRLREAGERIAGSLFVPADALKGMSGEAGNRARLQGLLDEEEWYVFPAGHPPGDEAAARNPRVFVSSGRMHALRITDLRELSAEQRRAVRHTDMLGLKRRSGQYGLLLAAILVFSFLQVYAASWIGEKVMADMRGGLLAHVMRQSLRYLGGTPVGRLVSRIANDVGTISEFFTNVTISFLKDAAMMAGVIAALFVLDYHLAWISLITMLPTFALILVFRSRMRDAFRRVRARLSALNAFLSERISGMSTVQLFDSEVRSAEEFSEKGKALLGAEMREMHIMSVFRPLIDLISSSAAALVIWYSAGLHQSGRLSLGVLIAFVQLTQKFFQPVTDIAEKFNILQSAMAGGERIFAMMDEEDRISDEAEERTGGASDAGEIRFENVHFSYVPGEPVLRGLNFRIEAGHTAAVVGATGAGKTTIANLITRLWDPDEGRILLDGRDIRRRPLADLRHAIIPVQQDVFLFSGSIAENIDLGRGMDRASIIEAAKLARADPFISRLPESYDTPVTEGAGNLSAGERQLIAFARIIAHNPRLIILDEATANVDTETEALLQEGLETLLRERTAVVIAHRLSTIRRADRILVLARGRLIEQGTHDELLAAGGVYSNLHQLQFAENTHANSAL